MLEQLLAKCKTISSAIHQRFSQLQDTGVSHQAWSLTVGSRGGRGGGGGGGEVLASISSGLREFSSLPSL